MSAGSFPIVRAWISLSRAPGLTRVTEPPAVAGGAAACVAAASVLSNDWLLGDVNTLFLGQNLRIEPTARSRETCGCPTRYRRRFCKLTPGSSRPTAVVARKVRAFRAQRTLVALWFGFAKLLTMTLQQHVCPLSCL